jgi:DNA (cytosine-5)-methyltransferase 1
VIYADICAGISAATVAWKPLGWRAAFYAEIDRFPSAVLRHHYPDTPNLGDMTGYDHWPDAALDVLIGGTPCQGFSVAGLRKGLDDDRSNLALCFALIAQRYRPRWIVWENVPGVRSAGEGRDLGAFLRGLAELGYGLCWRSLDAQFAGLAQRRERLFAVGHLGDWRPAAAVLLEPEGMRWDPAPCREAGEGVARPIASCAPGGSGYRNDADTADNLIQVAPTLRAGCNATGGDRPYGTDVDTCDSLVPFAIPFDTTQITSQVNRSRPEDGDPAPTLAKGAHAPALAFQPRYARNDRGAPQEELAYPLTAEAGRTGKGDSAQVVSTGWAVRRLTPRECERLQGFPDDYTRISWRGKPVDGCPDGPRYKALGNSIAVPCLRWIGERIELCETVLAR